LTLTWPTVEQYHPDSYALAVLSELLTDGKEAPLNEVLIDEAKVAAGSVVLKDVPAQCTVAGVPAKQVGGPCCEPARTMDQAIPEDVAK
ncbi:MAG: hypothetical protein AAGL11_02410, partial [Pseudomonadota bacterium]